jgi:hypothetical protein
MLFAGSTMADRLDAERKTYEANLPGWRAEHLGSFVLIKDQEVVGFFDSLDAATREGFRRFGLEDFFVSRIDPSELVNVTFLGQHF